MTVQVLRFLLDQDGGQLRRKVCIALSSFVVLWFFFQQQSEGVEEEREEVGAGLHKVSFKTVFLPTHWGFILLSLTDFFGLRPLKQATLSQQMMHKAQLGLRQRQPPAAAAGAHSS